MNRSKLPNLAIDGGPQTRAVPWPVRRLFGEDEKQAVLALFDAVETEGAGALGYNGPQEDAYAREFAASLGGGFADALNSGTNALYVAFRALEIEPGAEVIVPSVTDVGGITPVVLSGCIPVPADAAPMSYNMGPDQVAARLSPRTAAIIVAHIAGIPVDIDPILDLARARSIPVIEDSAQAQGATYRGRPVGTFGRIAVFSTMFGKHHASGGQGGLVFTRSEDLYWKVRRYADRGKPFGIDPPAGNVVAALNCNMDELHAAIGRAQLRKLPAMLARRRQVAARIADGCAARLKAVRLLADPPWGTNAYWFLLFRIHLDRLGVDKAAFIKALAAEGIGGLDASYRHVPTQMPWFTERRAFGARSEWPWSLAADPLPRRYELPNVDAADAAHFRMFFHEAFAEREADDIVAALEKLEQAYLK